MRIAYVCTDRGVPVFGRKGSSIHVQEIIRAFQRSGARVDLFATTLGGPAPADWVSMEVVELPEFAGLSRSPAPGEVDAANAGLAARLESTGQYDLVYERHALWSTGAVIEAARQGRPLLLEVNAPLVDEAVRFRGLSRASLARSLAAAAVRGATRVIAVSDGVARYTRAIDPRPGHTVVIPNGVDPRRFAPRRRSPSRGEFVVGFLGTMKPWHGLGVLVEAFRRLASARGSVRLLMVGDGPDREALAARVEAVGLADRVEWTGAVDPAAVPGLLARMDVGVVPYPSADCYFSPLKVFEYLAAGLPVVASRVGQLEALLLDGRTALLVQPGDPEALAAAIGRLADDPALRCRLGGAGRRWVESDHTWDRVAARLRTLIPHRGGLALAGGAR